METARSIWRWQIILLSVLILDVGVTSSQSSKTVSSIPRISKHWGNLKPYENVPEDQFGVKNTGLPHGCQIEQVQILHRHGARNPPSVEYSDLTKFAAHVAERADGERFRGPLAFLNSWSLQLGRDALVPMGSSMAYTSGTDAWNRYGRILYKATPGQTAYNATGQDKPQVRCNTLPRVFDTAHGWAEGFFGPYNATSKYSLLAMPFAPDFNNTLASIVTCPNFGVNSIALSRNPPLLSNAAALFLSGAKDRLAQYFPSSMEVTEKEIFEMQQLCVYEYVALGSSDFCELFTLDEWKDYEYVLDSYYYNYGSFGSPLGRALGIGVWLEMLARLKGQYITTSQTSINSTLSSNPNTFPLNQKLYADFTHDFIIFGVVTAMSMDYFRKPLPLSFPPPAKRNFRLADITPYAARFVVEKIGCNSSEPKAMRETDTQYTPSQYGYSPADASHKFVRIRLNNGILPLREIRGGQCRIRGRTDGLCPLAKFLRSQQNAETLANYQFACFGNYNVSANRFRGDGNYFP